MAWEKKTAQLNYPITIGEGDEAREIKEATIQMPNGRQLLQIEAMLKEEGLDQQDPDDVGIDLSLRMLAIMSDLGKEGTEELHIKDIVELGEIMAPFLEEALTQLMGKKAPSQNSSDGGQTTETPSAQT